MSKSPRHLVTQKKALKRFQKVRETGNQSFLPVFPQQNNTRSLRWSLPVQCVLSSYYVLRTVLLEYFSYDLLMI